MSQLSSSRKLPFQHQHELYNQTQNQSSFSHSYDYDYEQTQAFFPPLAAASAEPSSSSSSSSSSSYHHHHHHQPYHPHHQRQHHQPQPWGAGAGSISPAFLQLDSSPDRRVSRLDDEDEEGMLRRPSIARTGFESVPIGLDSPLERLGLGVREFTYIQYW
ncbi:hypothetical protein BDY24DRAFT_395681 [Mrakia frigida]|uniref:uncharacterized protein n=1 Tax=Mrakia frigida TaxID=29902 RepID=UPI003FCC0E69